MGEDGRTATAVDRDVLAPGQNLPLRRRGYAAAAAGRRRVLQRAGRRIGISCREVPAEHWGGAEERRDRHNRLAGQPLPTRPERTDPRRSVRPNNRKKSAAGRAAVEPEPIRRSGSGGRSGIRGRHKPKPAVAVGRRGGARAGAGPRHHGDWARQRAGRAGGGVGGGRGGPRWRHLGEAHFPIGFAKELLRSYVPKLPVSGRLGPGW